MDWTEVVEQEAAPLLGRRASRTLIWRVETG